MRQFVTIAVNAFMELIRQPIFLLLTTSSAAFCIFLASVPYFGFGDDPKEDTYDLRWNIECYAGRMPPGLLPIATTSCGDQLCLWLTGELRGAVVLWDHQAEHHPPTQSNLHFIAPSFTAFLALLTEAPDA